MVCFHGKFFEQLLLSNTHGSIKSNVEQLQQNVTIVSAILFLIAPYITYCTVCVLFYFSTELIAYCLVSWSFSISLNDVIVKHFAKLKRAAIAANCFIFYDDTIDQYC